MDPKQLLPTIEEADLLIELIDLVELVYNSLKAKYSNCDRRSSPFNKKQKKKYAALLDRLYSKYTQLEKLPRSISANILYNLWYRIPPNRSISFLYYPQSKSTFLLNQKLYFYPFSDGIESELEDGDLGEFSKITITLCENNIFTVNIKPFTKKKQSGELRAGKIITGSEYTSDLSDTIPF